MCVAKINKHNYMRISAGFICALMVFILSSLTVCAADKEYNHEQSGFSIAVPDDYIVVSTMGNQNIDALIQYYVDMGYPYENILEEQKIQLAELLSEKAGCDMLICHPEMKYELQVRFWDVEGPLDFNLVSEEDLISEFFPETDPDSGHVIKSGSEQINGHKSFVFDVYYEQLDKTIKKYLFSSNDYVISVTLNPYIDTIDASNEYIIDAINIIKTITVTPGEYHVTGSQAGDEKLASLIVYSVIGLYVVIAIIGGIIYVKGYTSKEQKRFHSAGIAIDCFRDPEDNLSLIDRIKDFYKASASYPMGMKWHNFFFELRIPLGLILSLLSLCTLLLPTAYRLEEYLPSVTDAIASIISVIFLFIIICYRNKYSYYALCVMIFQESFFLWFNNMTPYYLGIALGYFIFNFVYFYRRRFFFDRFSYETIMREHPELVDEIYDQPHPVESSKDVKNVESEYDGENAIDVNERTNLVEQDLSSQNNESNVESSMLTSRTAKGLKELQKLPIDDPTRIKYCNKCGQQLQAGYRFCLKCGTPIKEELDNIERNATEVNSKVEPTKSTNTSFKSLSEDDVQQIRYWKQLLNDGIISEEEFKEKKKEILGD